MECINTIKTSIDYDLDIPNIDNPPNIVNLPNLDEEQTDFKLKDTL